MRAPIFLNTLNRVVGIYQEMGWRVVAARLWHRVRVMVGHDDQKHAQWLRQKLATDAAFDGANRTETGGVRHLYNFEITGENARFGLSHIASDPGEFAAMIERLNTDLRAYTFIDLGSGKGRALMLAAAFPFRRIVGVEFAKELHEAAISNFALDPKRSADPRIEFIWGDAAAYEFPAEPLIVYLFNPFGPTIVRRTADAILASWRAAPRPVNVLYMNPLYLSDFTDAGWVLRENSHGFAHLVPPAH